MASVLSLNICCILCHSLLPIGNAPLDALAGNLTYSWTPRLVYVSGLNAQFVRNRMSIINRGFTVIGMSWRNLSLQAPNITWHLQAVVTPNQRIDTGKPNNSPQAFSKPMYRIPLGQEKHIQITTLDPDGDFVKCALSKNQEAYLLATIKLPDVTVTEDCIIKIPAYRSLGYQNGTFGGIAVTIRDYKEQLQFSSIGLQFLVQFLEVINEPKLIYKTPDDRHRFNVYYGTTWQIDLFAEAVTPAIIDHFSYVRRQENLTFTEMKNVSVPDYKNVTMATLTWSPLQSDVGEHIVCVNVEDSVGMDSSDQRCFTISVKPHYNTIQLANIQTDNPYFINLPDKDSLSCDVNATCIFPVYAKTPKPGANITAIWIGKYFLDSAVNDTKIAISDIGIGKMDIRVRHVSDGSPSLCLYAMDSTGAVSNETCINPSIIPPDPCLKRPCNHGTCIRSTDDLTQFHCQCLHNFYGTFCEKEFSNCPPHRCQNGDCRDLHGGRFMCNCTRGWTGTLCERLIDNCKNVNCGGHGLCKNDGPGKYSCDCFQRYGGGNCTIDKCNTTYRDDKTCNEPGCNAASCSQHGLCTEGGVCHCSLGFEDSPNCSNSKSDISHQQVNFVQPSPLEGSTIACFNSKPCKFSVFIAGGTDLVVRIQHVSDNLKNILHVSAPEEVKYVPGIQHMYESLISIDAPPEKTYLGHQYVCLEVDNRITHSVGTHARCYNIFYTTDSTQATPVHSPHGTTPQRNKSIQFIEPTPKDNSRFICKVNNVCHLFVYTNKDNTSSCREVVSHSGVYVQPAISAGAHCFADVSYNFSNEALHTVCLQADEKDGETRCFTLDIIGHSNDPCISNPCQNIGICLRKDNSTFKCICGEEYTGSNCERGPCLLSESTCQHGYCEINNRTQTCFCPLGYKGTKCNIAIPDEVKHPNNDNSTFTDVFLPTEIVCVKNKPCVIPFVVSGIYSFPSKPTVDVGYVSPSIEINGISPLEQKSSTNATYISEIMFTPTVPGKQKICLQTLSQNRINLDEICFNVDVRTDALILFGDKDKPHFTPPSITMNSTVVCKTGVPCHMVFRVSSGRSHENNCSSMKVVEGLTEHYHIFSDCETCTDGPSAVSNCTMDLVFNPTHITHFRLCLEAQLKWRDVTGEVRCFDINVVGDNYNFSGPCSRLHCMNGGFCDAENAGGVHPVCHCPIGFSGIRCESDEPPSISNNTNRPSVGNLALPVEIYCNYNESCSIPFLLLGQPHNIPFVGPGHIPPAITVENLVIDSTHSTGKQFEGYLQIRLMGNATQPVCIQSKSGNSTNRVLEEICFKVQVGEGQLYGPPVDKSRPHYIDPTLPDRSTVLCKTGSECHILMYTSKTSSNCPTVSETQDYTDGLHIFLAASRNGYDCVIDISYIPPKTMQGQKKMCLQVSLPGFKGEVRCYVVISLEKANLSTGLCINKECNNGGHCDSNVQEARCICRVGHGGDMCTGSSKFVEPQNVPPNMQLTESPVFTDLAVPDTLICYVRLECWLPIIINGNTSPNKPTLKFGYMDTDWTAGTQMLDGGTVNGVYSGSVSFRPTTLGEYPFCIQTAISASQHISDEICCIVKVLDPSRKPTELPFQSPTLNANSAVKCQVNTTCHILSYLIQVNGQCPELIQTSVVENVFVFSPDKTENKCVIDTAFIPSSSQMGINTLCLKTRNNDNMRCIDIRVVEKIKVATSSTTTETTSSTTVTSPSTSTTSQSPVTSQSTVATSSTTTETTFSTTVTSPSTLTTSQTPSTKATSHPTTATSTKVTSQSVHLTSQSTGTTTSPSITSISTLKTTHSPATSLSTPATSQSTVATSSTTTEKTSTTVTSPSTMTTSQSPVTSPSTQSTSKSTVATSSTTTEKTSTTVTSPSTMTTSQSPVTSPSTQSTSQSTVATSSTTSEMTSSTTVTSSTLTTSQSPATPSTQATSQPTTATSTKVTSQSVHSASQSTGTTTSPSTRATSQSTGTTTSPSTRTTSQSTGITTSPSTRATSQSTGTTTSPSTRSTSQSTGTTTFPSTRATSQSTGTTTSTSSTRATSQSTGTTTSPSTQATSQSTGTTTSSTQATSQSTGTTTSPSTTSQSTLKTTHLPATSFLTQAASQSTGTTTSASTTSKSTFKTTQLPSSVSTQSTSQSIGTTTFPSTTLKSTLKTTHSPATSLLTQATLISTEAASQKIAATTGTSSKVLTTEAASTGVSTTIFATSSTTTEKTSSTTVTSQSTSTTSQSPATSSTQATSQPTTATSTKVTSQSVHSASQSTGTTTSPSTRSTSQSTGTTTSPSTRTTSQTTGTTSSTRATSQTTGTTTSPSTRATSQTTGTTTSSTASKSTLTTTQSPATSPSTQTTSQSTGTTTSSTQATSQSTGTTTSSTQATSQSTGTTASHSIRATSQSTSTTTSPSTQATSQSTGTTSPSAQATSQSTGTTTSSSTSSKSTLTTTQSPATSLSTQATPVSTEAASPLIVATPETSSNAVTTQAPSTGVSTTTLAAGIAGGVVGVTAAAGVGTFIVKKLRKKISVNKLLSPRTMSTVHPETPLE